MHILADTDETVPTTGTGNHNTRRKTKAHSKLFQTYLQSKGELRPFHTIPAFELDDLLGDFITDIKNEPKNQEFCPEYLRNIQSSLERCLKSESYPYSITRSPFFRRSRYRLKMKIDRLKQNKMAIDLSNKRFETLYE